MEVRKHGRSKYPFINTSLSFALLCVLCGEMLLTLIIGSSE